MNVPFLDLQIQYRSLRPEVDQAVATVLGNCNFILGKEVEEFERAFAEFLETGFALGISSGLDALSLGLRALGVGPGDEVIIPANTFIASALAVTGVGATPVLVDMDPATFNIDPARIEAAVTPRTKAIMPVHLYGRTCDLDPILEIARLYDLRVIEDASQAHGARYKGQRVGTLGDIGCFSFYPGKNLGAYGDGGAVATPRRDLADRIARLRNYGQEKKYHHSEKGFNHRLDTIQAAVLNVKLKHLETWNQRRAEHAARYSALLKDIPGVITPELPEPGAHVFHLYVIRSERRDELQKFLAEKGVATIIHYPIPIHLQDAYRDLGHAPEDFPHTTKLAGEILSLPMFPELTDEQIEVTVAAIRAFSEAS